MKRVVFLHGLESKAKSDKATWLSENFEAWCPALDYRNPQTFEKVLQEVRKFNPDLIIGSSMGGWFAYCLSTITGVDTLLFNPAVHSRSIEPFVQIGNIPSNHTVILGKFDEIIRPELTESWLSENCIGNYNIYFEDIGHRSPLPIMIKHIEKMSRITENKKIKKYEQYIVESKDSNYLLYYAFDWDDNILSMPTKIVMYKKDGDNWILNPVSTATFAEVRNDQENWKIDKEKAFEEFRDNGPRGESAFIEDVKMAVSMERFAPAWDDFVECLTHGSLFAIITARGHESDSMRTGVEWIIDNVLSSDEIYQMYNHLRKFEYFFKDTSDSPSFLSGKPSEHPLIKAYLDNCDFVGVSSPSRGGTPENPEKAKEEALLSFASKVNSFCQIIGMRAKIGFSDDDLKNVKHIEDLIENIDHEKFSNIMEFVVKGTKDPSSITKKVRTMNTLSMTETSHQTPGLESSVLKFTQFGNMTGHLNPQGPDRRQDDAYNSFKRATDYLTKNSEEIVGRKKRKKPVRKTK